MVVRGKEPEWARQDADEKLKGNTAGHQAHQQDHVFDTQGHSSDSISFDGLSMEVNNGDRWERYGLFDGMNGQ